MSSSCVEQSECWDAPAPVRYGKWPVPAAPAVPETPPAPTPTFVPLALPAPSDDGEIRIELQRAGTAVKIVWPASAARDCAAWLRDWLR